MQRIRTALAEDRFVLYGQPIADLRTGRITHHELLVRMLSEDGDIIPPAAFLPMAERFGVIGEIDRWVTSAGLRLAIDGEGVAMNLSGYSIGDPAIVAEIRAAIADGVDPGKVIFDVTEAAAMTSSRPPGSSPASSTGSAAASRWTTSAPASPPSRS